MTYACNKFMFFELRFCAILTTQIAIESIENIRTVASFSLEDHFYREFLNEVAGPYR